jgi:hypothetical protein
MRSARTLVLCALAAAATLAGCDEDKKPASAGTSDAGATGGTVGTGTAGTTGAATGGTTGTGNGGTSGNGGAAGTPGAGGAPGTGGIGVPPAAACNIPCIVEISKDCVPTGACLEQSSGLFASNKCYANGVKVISTAVLANPPVYSSVYKKDGNVCYTLDAELAANGATLKWKNPAGAVVATGTIDSTKNEATVTCGGQTYDSAATAACAGTLSLPSLPGIPGGSATTCTMGACTP